MVTIQQQQQIKDSSVIVEQELKRLNANQLYAAVNNASSVLMALGISEAIFGIVAILLPVFSGALFLALLGGAVLISGVIEIVSGIAQGAGGRTTVGMITALAGLLVIGHPLFGFAFLGALVGLYLIAAGITRFFEPRKTGWPIASGITGIVLGLIVLASSPAVSAGVIGLVVGINLVLGGIMTMRTSSAMRMALR